MALGFVLVLAIGVGALFCFLILQRELITLRTAHAKRREAVLTPWVHRALSGGGAGPAALHLKQMLRRFDRRVVRDVLLQLALDLRGEDAEHIARLYWRLGLLDLDLARSTPSTWSSWCSGFARPGGRCGRCNGGTSGA